MVEQVEKTKRNFFFFNDGNFEVKNVEAFSCEGFPETWFVPGAGTCLLDLVYLRIYHRCKNTQEQYCVKKKTYLKNYG